MLVSNIEQIIEAEKILLKTNVKGLLIEACIEGSHGSVLNTNYSQDELLPQQVGILFTIYNGNEKLGYCSIGFAKKAITLANVITLSKTCLGYLSEHLANTMKEFFTEILIESIDSHFIGVMYSLPAEDLAKTVFHSVKHYRKSSEISLKQRLGLAKAGRPQGGFKFKRAEDFLKKLVPVARELKKGKSNITVNSLCKFIKPKSIDLKTFKATCERFGLDQDKLLALLRAESSPNTKNLLTLAKKEDTDTKVSELILKN